MGRAEARSPDSLGFPKKNIIKLGRKKMKRIIYLIQIILILSYCGPKQEKVDRIIEDGVEVVINHLEPYKIGNISSFSLEEVLKIDTEEDEITNIGIPDILGFEVNSLREIFILRTYTGEGDFIFKFDSSGKFIKSFGPQGQGPGEFQNPHHIALDSEDNILILDFGRQTLLKYDRHGVFINDYGRRIGTSISSGPGANLLVLENAFDLENGKQLFSLKLLNPDLEVLQVIDKFGYFFVEKSGKYRATEPLFYWSASRDNIYVANEDRGYEIWVFDFNGKLIRKIQKEYKQIPVSENYKKKILKQFPEDMKAVLYFPEFHTPLQSLVAGDDGKLLVSTYEAGNGPGEFSGTERTYPIFINIGRDGKLYANDIRVKKVIVFDQIGEYVREYKYKGGGVLKPIVDSDGNCYFLSAEDNRVINVYNQKKSKLITLKNEKESFNYLFVKPGVVYMEMASKNPAGELLIDLTVNSKLLIYFPSSSIMYVLKDKKILKKMNIWPKEALNSYKTELNDLIKGNKNIYNLHSALKNGCFC